MNTLFLGTEASLFCLFLTGFLFFFRLKYVNNSEKNCSMMYIFSILAILLSAVWGFLSDQAVKNEIVIAGIVCYLLSSYFLCSYVVGVYSAKSTVFQISISAIVCLLFAALTRYAFVRSANIHMYLLVISLVIVFVFDLYNRIRTDNLTKLYNRYGMDVEISRQRRQYEHNNADSFYIIACDLDKFKQINDTWGHAEGDRALRLVADMLSRVCKQYDSEVFRIGGDEFIIITDKSDKTLAGEVIEAVHDELDTVKFRKDFTIGISLGAALYDGVKSIDELMKEADKKLYEAKQTGNKKKSMKKKKSKKSRMNNRCDLIRHLKRTVR